MPAPAAAPHADLVPTGQDRLQHPGPPRGDRDVGDRAAPMLGCPSSSPAARVAASGDRPWATAWTVDGSPLSVPATSAARATLVTGRRTTRRLAP